MPGPPKKLERLKVASGTSRPDRPPLAGVELPAVSALPPAPDWLPNAHAVKEWDRLGRVLVANKLLTDAGLSAFGMLCALHGKLVQLWAAGESPTGHMMAQYRALVNDFGLTPVAQGKVKPIGKEDEANPFARNGKPSMVA